MHPCNDFDFLDHTFHTNILSTEMEKILSPEGFPLLSNAQFLSCCVNGKGDKNVYITVKNKNDIVELFEDIKDDLTQNRIFDLVDKKISEIEQHLLLTTNVHIFLPYIFIKVYTSDNQEVLKLGDIHNCPLPFGKWIADYEKINFNRRLSLTIDRKPFMEFLNKKSTERYKRAFDYYIKSFYEFDHSVAFCLLCAAIDAITGNSKSGVTKKRLAKYSSVLFCTPSIIDAEEIKMQKYYKLRSDYIHGKKSRIQPNDEIVLREYVRKFLIAYYFFWEELKIKNESQMLQIIDKIYDDHKLYTKLVPSAYSFICMMNEHEKRDKGVIDITMQEKLAILISIFNEANQ